MKLLYSEHKRRYLWNAVILASTTFMAVYIPLGLLLDMRSMPVVKVLYWICSAVFIADIFVKFLRYKKESVGSDDPKRTLFSRWLLIDVTAAIPFGALFGAGPIELVRLVKLARVAQYFRGLRQAEVRYSIALTLVSFFFWIAIMIHWLCSGWMAIYGIDPSADNATNYITALYWTVTTLTAVGYGDIVPVTNAQRLFAIVVQLSGVAVFGYLIANVVSIVSKMDAVRARYAEHLELFTTAVKRRGLSRDLQRRILDYYAYLRDEKTGYDESAFLQSLPESLKTEVALNLKREFIEGIPLFNEASEHFLSEIALKLELVVATPGDYIFKTGDAGDGMYFIISGTVDVLNATETRRIVSLGEGEFFGEIALFNSDARSATVKASTYCNLYKLRRKTFKTVITNHPEVAEQLEAKAKMREERDGREGE